jgi:hypothetical protein
LKAGRGEPPKIQNMTEGKQSKRAAAWLRGHPEPFVFSAYFLITVFMTYPAITLFHRTYAEPMDPLGSIWELWWLRFSFHNHIAVSPMRLVAVPFGVTLDIYKADPLYGLTRRALTLVFTETVTYNVLLLLFYTAAAVACYYLVRHLTDSRPAAAVCGVIFAFSPYMLAHGKEHLSLLATGWIPLFALLVVRAWKSRTFASIAVCGLAYIALTAFNYQYGLLTGAFAVVFLATIYLTGRPWARGKRDRAVIWKALPVVAVVVAAVVLMLVSLSGSPQGQKKAAVSAYQYSARPWDYFIPPAEGALFGGLTHGFITSHLHGGFIAENSLFLGYVPLALALVAIAAAGLRRRAAALETAFFSVSDSRRLVCAFTASAAVAFLLSMPPSATVGSARVYLPSHLVFKVLPQFRAFARFGVIVTLCVAVLAGYGIKVILLNRRFSRRATVVASLLALLILLEFTIVPPFYVLDTDRADGYSRWLEKHGAGGAAAVYPLYAKDDFDNYAYFFQQRLHGRELVNGADPGSEAEMYRQSVLDLYNEATPGLLKRLGADYLVVLPDLLAEKGPPHQNYTFPTDFEPSRLPDGLVKTAVPEGAVIYEITAEPADFVPLFGAGSYEPYMDPEGSFWHPAQNRVLVDIQSDLEGPAACDLRFRMMSARSLSRVEFRLGGLGVGQAEVPVWPVDVVLRGVVLEPGNNTVVIESDGDKARLTNIPRYSVVSAAMMIGGIVVERQR